MVLAGCGSAETPAVEEPEEPSSEETEPSVDVSVALLMPGTISDGGWNGLAYQGLQQLAEEGFDVAYTENVPQADIPSVARGYADDGYDLIFGNGWQFGSAFMEVAAEYPDIYFFVNATAPEGVPSNLQFVDPSPHLASYMTGALAALVSENNVVGFVGGGDNPVQRAMGNAYAQGAEETVEGTTALQVITGDYNDAARGREAALTMIGNGADVIWHAADITGLGVIAAAVDSGAIAIGCYSDQTSIWYPSFASSLTMDLAYMVYSRGHAVADGTFEGGGDWMPTFSDIWKFSAGEPRFNSEIVSDDMVAQIDEIIANLENGTIEVPYVTE
jgi:basic membrane protein A